MKRSGMLLIIGAGLFLFGGMSSVHAAVYYVKSASNDGNDSNDGRSDANAWGTIDKVNGYNFVTGDDVYFKCGDVWTGNALTIDWKGTSDDRVTIGAYYDNGIIGISGSKPIINRGVTGNGVTIDGQDYVTVQNLDIRKGNNAFVISTVNADANYPIVEKCNIGAGTTGYGLRIYSGHQTTGGIIRNNVVDSRVGIYGQDESLMYDGIKLTAAANYYKVHDNIIRDWAHTAMRMEDSDYCEWYENYITCVDLQGGDPHKPTSSGRGFGFSGDAKYNKIYLNYFKNMRTLNQLLGGTYNEIYNNIFDTITSEETYGGCMLSISGNGAYVAYNKIYNNVFYRSLEETGYTLGGTIRMYAKLGWYDCEYNEIRNNIFLEPNVRALYMANWDGIKNNIFTNNIMYKTNETQTISYRGAPTLTVSEWEAAASNGDIISDNIALDPSLANPVNGEFWPDELTDPVVDAGIDVGLTEDYLENIRPFGSAPDIGAYEYVPPSAPSPTDLNQDSRTDIQDIQFCVKVILETEIDPDIVVRADVNKDGNVNTLDIQEVVNAVLNR
ncbi:hypothetical protein KAR34_14015 [bacterium]|nr:hypothetical protein [bacterium]